MPVAAPVTAVPLESIAHIIQVALTPVFLLSGIGSLLGVFNTTLARVSDHIEHVTELLAADSTGKQVRKLRLHLLRLHRRTLALDCAMVMGSIGGAFTCGAAFALFVGTLRDVTVSSVLFALFGAALACVVVALAALITDSLLAWHGLKIDGPTPHSHGPR